MERSRLFAAIALAGTFVTGSAWAVNWSGSKTIQELRQSFQKDAYEVTLTTALSGPNDNPANCTDNTTAEMDVAVTASQKDLMNRTLLSAYLAGKNIRLHIKESAGACQNNRPIYEGVRF